MTSAYTALPGLNYTLVMTMATSFLAGDALPVVGSFRLDGTRRTIEPPDPTITWTATIDGDPLDLRIAGVGSLESNVTSEAADSGTYWQSSVSLEFDEIGSAADQVLIVTGSATMVETAISDSKAAAVPDYSLVLSGPAAIFFDTVAVCIASFRADTVDKTAEPSNKTITWSSTIEGSPVDLRIEGGFAASVEDTVTDVGLFWEVSSSLKFDMSREFVDRTLVVTGAGVIDGLAVNDSTSVTVEGWYDLGGVFFCDLTGLNFSGTGGNDYRMRINIVARVIDLPSTVEWYKQIECRFLNDNTYSEEVFSETGSDPGNVRLDIIETRDYNGDKTGTLTVNWGVGQQVANKQYDFEIICRTGTTSNNFTLAYSVETKNFEGVVVESYANDTIPTITISEVRIDTIEEVITVDELGNRWN